MALSIHSMEFMSAFHSGNQLAFRKFFDATVTRLTRIILSKCAWVRYYEVEEFVSTAYCKVYARRGSYKDYDHAMASLTTIAYHEAVSYERHRVLEYHGEKTWWDMLGPLEEDHPSEQLSESDQLAQIKKAVSRLPRQEKTVFELSFYKNKSISEISKFLGIAEMSAYGARIRAVQRIRELLHVKKPPPSRYNNTGLKSYRAQVQKAYRERGKSLQLAGV